MHPSLAALESAVLILAVCTAATALVVFLLMVYRQERRLARESRRLVLIDLLAPHWNAEVLKELWAASRRSSREILEEVVAARRQALEGEHAREFERALIHSGIFDHWLEQVRRRNATRRVRAAMRLGLIRDARGIEALVAATRDPSPQVVLAAVLSLGRLQDPRGLPGLVALAEAPRRSFPDLTLAAALAACAVDCPPQLAPLLRARHPRSRALVAWALSEVANRAVLADLLAAANDPEAEVRAKVARALARILSPDVLDCLHRLAADPMWFVRVRALDALGRLGVPGSEAVVLTRLGDPVREVRYRAAYALRKISGMRSGILEKALAAGSRKGLDSLISEWERAGFLWQAVEGLVLHDPSRFRESEGLVRTLAGAGITHALVHLAGAHPNLKVRLRLVHLLAENSRRGSRRELEELGRRPECDSRVAKAIRLHLARTSATPRSAA